MHFILVLFNHRPFQSRSSCFDAPRKPRSQCTAVPVSFAVRYTSLPPFPFSRSSHPEKRASTQIEESCTFTKVLRSSLSLPAALSAQLVREGRDQRENTRIEDSVLSPSPLPPSLWVIISFRTHFWYNACFFPVREDRENDKIGGFIDSPPWSTL